MLTRLLSTIIAGSIATLSALALPAAAQVAVPSDGSIALNGKVVETFGAPFIIETEQGRILVLARGFTGGISQGDMLTLSGRLTQRTLDAETIRRDDADLYRAPALDGTAGPAPAGIAATLTRLGLTQLAPPERKKRHVEIATRDASGHNIVASFDLSGRIMEVEDADLDKKRAPVKLSSDAEAIAIVTRAGLVPTGRLERKKHHFEIEATSAAGELIEVQVDLSGYIFKKIWLN